MNTKLVGVLINAETSIDVIRGATQEFANGNADLANPTDEKASAIEQTTASLAEMTEAVEHNALGAERANIIAHETAESPQASAEEVQRTVKAMARVCERSRKIAENLICDQCDHIPDEHHCAQRIGEGSLGLPVRSPDP